MLADNRVSVQQALYALKLQLHTADQQLLRLPSHASMERAALALRKCLEGVALSTLIVNAPLLNKAERAMAKMNANDFLKAVEKANPGFWPQPVDMSKPTGMIEASGAASGQLRREDYGRAIGTTSEWLHWRNPLAPPQDAETGRSELEVIFVGLERLLRSFLFTLPGDPDSLLLCSINFGRPGARTVNEPPTVTLLTRQQPT
ncbi:hypothetical protein [Microbacterium enclense]|uniref:hypothetical protein n=1 Tax=Microbacterium enclense TaxID=993073 RepID=UPI003F815B09